MPDKETALVQANQVQSLEKKTDAQQAKKLTLAGAFTPTNLTEAIALSKLIATSELAPKDYKGKPANVLIAMQMGAEVGLAPMQALQNIAVINGRPSLWGDAALGIVQVSPMYEWHKESITGEGDSRTASCQVKRRNQEASTATFSVANAKKAGLWGKAGPWQNYPDRMLQMRARGFALRDKFSDALRGLILAEEAMDIPVDTSQAKQQRDAATLDIATVLSPSSEQNRGHNDTGLERSVSPESKETKRNEDVLCSDCRKVNGHEESCPHYTKAQQDAKTSARTTKMRLAITKMVAKRKKKDSDQHYLQVPVMDEQQNKFILYVWDTKFFAYFEKQREGVFHGEVSEKSGFRNLEHLLMFRGQKFVNDAPVDESGTLEPAEPEGIPMDFNE